MQQRVLLGALMDRISHTYCFCCVKGYCNCKHITRLSCDGIWWPQILMAPWSEKEGSMGVQCIGF
jgi:hypothetical protein